MQRGRHWLLGLFAVVPTLAQAQEQSDWLDEFPSVTAVAHAAFEELAVTAKRGNLDLTRDDDSIAVNLAGTFVALRQILMLKRNAEPDMSIERAQKLREILAAYEEAELTIGQGATDRVGYIKRGPPTGMGCGSDMECYRRWFQLHLNASSGRAEYRHRLLRRLFPCGTLAKELDDLRQKNVVRMPYTPSPSTTLAVDRQLEGVGKAGCSAYGGDADGNGLCDDWGRVPQPGKLATAASEPSCLVLTRVRTADEGGLKVSIQKGSAEPGQRVRLRIVRAAKSPIPDVPAPCGATGAASEPCELWSGEASIVSEPGSAGALSVTIARGASLAPGETEAREFLVVDAESARSGKPVYCKQPLLTWLPSQKSTIPSGLHGPYDSVDLALQSDSAGTLALQRTSSQTVLWGMVTDKREYGFLIVRDARIADRLSATGGYYTTPPLPSSAEPGAKPLFLPEDYYQSFLRAFPGSCEEPASFEVVATVHTHPDQFGAPDNFSTDDFNQAIGFLVWQDYQFGSGSSLPVKLEKIAMINKSDGLIRTFVPEPGDEPIDNWMIEKVVGDLWWLSDTWARYAERVKEIGPPPAP